MDTAAPTGLEDEELGCGVTLGGLVAVVAVYAARQTIRYVAIAAATVAAGVSVRQGVRSVTRDAN